LGFEVSGVECRVQGSGFLVFRAQNIRSSVYGVRFKMWRKNKDIWVLRGEPLGVGCRIWGTGCRV
jgi:hypothetical protein